MFPLYSKKLPASAKNLERLLEESLRRAVDAPGNLVAIRDKAYPALDEIRIALDGARVRPNPLPPPMVANHGAFALTAEHLVITGERLSFAGASIDLNFDAQNVQLNQSDDRNA